LRDTTIIRPAIRLPLVGRLLGRASPARPDDRELVERARDGDGAAFGQLYDRYVADVFRYLRLRLDDAQLAEDLTQDVFLASYRALGEFRWQGHFRPWLLRCAHNRLVNHYRTSGRRVAEAELPDDDGPAPLASEGQDLELGLDLSLDIEAVRGALARLTPLQREVIVLRFGNELSVAETAEVMGRTLPSVKNLQLAALAAFRRQLTQDGAG
jgi:RNA polymerase sigma-70 factor (ECF subfamily)